MKKGIIATAILALSIGLMIVLISIRLCYWIPSLTSACWVQQQVQGSTEVVLLHHGQINSWSEKATIHVREREKEEHSVQVVWMKGTQECELGKTAAYALGNGDEKEALKKLESIALNATCLEVRKAAVHAIEGFGSDEARAALTRILFETAG